MLLKHISLFLLVLVVVGNAVKNDDKYEKNKDKEKEKEKDKEKNSEKPKQNKDLGWSRKNYRVEKKYSNEDTYDKKKYDDGYRGDDYGRYDDDYRGDDYGRYDDDDDDYSGKPSRPRKIYKKKPDSVGSMNIYFKQGKGKKTSYKKYRFPAARYDHKRHPNFGSLISFAPWLPMLVDRLTKQTFFCTPVGGIIVVPPIVNFFGHVIPVAKLILSGYASLVSTGAPLAPGFNVAPLVSDKPVVGSNVPKIDEKTGDFKGAVRVNYEAPKQADPPAYGEVANPRAAPPLIYSEPDYQQPPQRFQPPPPPPQQPPLQRFQPPPPPPPPMQGMQPDRPIYGGAQAQPIDRFAPPQPNYPNPIVAEDQFNQPRSGGFDDQPQPFYPPIINE